MTAQGSPSAAPDNPALIPFRKRVHEYVTEHSGFRFERSVAAAFTAAGFRTGLGVLYLDPLSAQYREIDVTAWHERQIGEVWFRVSIHVECKYSADDPWILFRPRRGGSSVETGARRYFHIKSKGVMPMLTRAAVHRARSPITRDARELRLLDAAHGYGDRLRVASKKSSHEDVAHKAIRGAIHSAIASTRAVEELRKDDMHVYELAIPVVATGAPLFAYDFDEAAEPDVFPINCGTVLAASPDVIRQSVLVDVVSAWPTIAPGAPPGLSAYAREQFADVEALLSALEPEMARIEARVQASRGADRDGSDRDG